MRTVLLIQTRSGDDLEPSLAESQQSLPDVETRRFDLTVPEPDYGLLIEEIFRADSVQVW